MNTFKDNKFCAYSKRNIGLSFLKKSPGIGFSAKYRDYSLYLNMDGFLLDYNAANSMTLSTAAFKPSAFLPPAVAK